jgi:membrane associated rhomboid family serine protease
MSFIDDLKYKFSNKNAVTYLIALNVAVYITFGLFYALFWLFQSGQLIDSAKSYFFLYAQLSHLAMQPWSIFTYMFFHDGFFHILFNMLWLYWLGMLLHEYLGNTRVYQAYFLGGLFGGLLYVLSFNIFPVFRENVAVSYALGASAGVLAVTTAAATLLPRYTILLFGIIPVQLRYIALISVLLDLINIPSNNSGGRIAHLGGALAGFLFIKYLYTNNTLTNNLHKVSELFKSFFKKTPTLKIHHKAPTSPTNKPSGSLSGKPNQADIDAILDKISKSGYESLSKQEKELLFKASQD